MSVKNRRAHKNTTNLFICRKRTNNPKMRKSDTRNSLNLKKNDYFLIMYVQYIIGLRSGFLIEFLTPLMFCVLILYISCGTYSLKLTPNNRFFEKLSTTILVNVRVFARNLLKGNRRRRNTFCIWFCCLAWGLNSAFTSNKPNIHTTH